MDATDRLLEFGPTGGPAANDDYLVVDRNGHAMLCTPEGSRRFEFSPGAVEQLGRELEIKDW
jgi:hypothetical protein